MLDGFGLNTFNHELTSESIYVTFMPGHGRQHHHTLMPSWRNHVTFMPLHGRLSMVTFMPGHGRQSTGFTPLVTVPAAAVVSPHALGGECGRTLLVVTLPATLRTAAREVISRKQRCACSGSGFLLTLLAANAIAHFWSSHCRRRSRAAAAPALTSRRVQNRDH